MTDEYWIKGAEWKRNIPQGSAIQKRTPNSISPNKINIAQCFQASGERQKKSPSNYVGYKGDTSVAGTDAGMMTSSFVDMSKVEQYTLANCSVTGYPPAEWDTDWDEWVSGTGCKANQFIVQELNGNGRTVAEYYWIDLDCAAHTEYPAGWYTNVTGTATYLPLDASTIKLGNCKGLWVFGKGLKLVSSGGVAESDLSVPTVAGTDAVGIANGTARDRTLDDLTVTGYPPAEWDTEWEEWVEGTGCMPGQFIVQKLNGNGRTIAMYYWIDRDCAAHTEYAAGWYTNVTGTATFLPLDATKINFQSGNGFWVFGKGLNLNVPCYKSEIVK